jgi:hypothetical protein
VESSHPRTFTREEAEALLPEVDRLLGQAHDLALQLASANQQAESAQWKVRSNGKVQPDASGQPSERSRRQIAEELRGLIEQIQGMGVVVRDIQSGLIDFPSIRDGRIVNLCWRRGEPLEIRWWHELDTGFAGRQPL